MLESHEDRLQALEATTNETSKGVATALVRIDGLAETLTNRTQVLSQQMEENQGRLIERMDAGFARVFEKLDPLAAKVEELTPRVVDLEKARATKARRLKQLAAVLVFVVAGVAGATLGQAGQALWAVVLGH